MTFGASSYGSTPLGSRTGEGENDKRVTGFVVTVHGSHAAAYLQIGSAAGAAPSTQFGQPNVLPGYVPSLGAITVFSTPVGAQRWQAASLGIITKAPQAFYAFAQTKAASGFLATKLGTSFAFTSTIGGGWTCRAESFLATQFGSPAAAYLQIGVMSGAVFAGHGAHLAVSLGAAAGIAPPLYGTARAQLRQPAGGVAVVQFGPATARTWHQASGSQFVQRFGTPAAVRPDTYRQYPTGVVSRFGRPTGLRRFNYLVTGFLVGALGVPTTKQAHRAAALAPITQFGTPVLRRPITC